MTIVKLKPVDRVLTRVSYYLCKFGGLTKIKLFYKADEAIIDRIMYKYIPLEIRAAGKMNACLSFDEIRY